MTFYAKCSCCACTKQKSTVTKTIKTQSYTTAYHIEGDVIKSMSFAHEDTIE